MIPSKNTSGFNLESFTSESWNNLLTAFQHCISAAQVNPLSPLQRHETYGLVCDLTKQLNINDFKFDEDHLFDDLLKLKNIINGIATNVIKHLNRDTLFEINSISLRKGYNGPNRAEALFQGVIAYLSESQIKKALNQWVSEAPHESDRESVRDEIHSFLADLDETRLFFGELKITSLPNIFNAPCFSRLKVLFLSESSLSTLPSTISFLSNLDSLTLEGCLNMTELPIEILQLPSSCKITLDECRLSTQSREFMERAVFAENYSGPSLLKPILDQWVHETSKEQFDRNVVAISLLNFFDQPQDRLTLYARGVTSLPNIFNAPCFIENLKKLIFCGSDLSTLPPSICQLVNLEELHLSGSPLTALPNTMNQLVNLKVLNLNGNPNLTTVPFEIFQLPSFCKIDLNGCGLSERELSRVQKMASSENCSDHLVCRFTFHLLLDLWVSDCPEEKKERDFTRVSFCNFFDNPKDSFLIGNEKVTSLPDIFGFSCFAKLKTLTFSRSGLSSLPPTICGLKVLEKLDLFGSELTELPTKIGELSNLKELNLTSSSKLTELPIGITLLPSSCIVKVLNCRFSAQTMEYIREAFCGENYTGPSFFKCILAHWEAEATNEQRYHIIYSLQDFLQDTDDCLDLTDYTTTSLPNIFSAPCFSKRLKILDLKKSKSLSKLPPTLVDLKNLEKLDLSECAITELPKGISNLMNLKELNLRHNPNLKHLPQEIFLLPSSCQIDLLGCVFSEEEQQSIQDVINGKGYCGPRILYLTLKSDLDNWVNAAPQEATRATIRDKLLSTETCPYLIFSNVTALPINFIVAGLHDKLRAITLSNNGLTTIPNEITQYPNVTNITLFNNRLVSLPHTIHHLTNLRRLILSNNPTLTGLPLQIFELPSTCTIDITGCGFSTHVLERIQETVSAEGYSGPHISHSMPRERLSSNRSIPELLKELYVIVGKEPTLLTQLLQDNELAENLQNWLSRLSHTADYQKGADVQKGFAEKIINYLELANSNPQFCHDFKIIIDGSTETCGDRVALSVLHLGIAYKLATIDRTDMPSLADFLAKGVWAMDMLEEIARFKIPTLPLYDELEVYLGYPVQLQAQLGLPIDVTNMIYFGCSSLTQTDLEEAKNHVKSMFANETAYFNFLISNENWVNALEAKFPEDFAEIKSGRDNDETNDLIKTQENYNNGLIKLSMIATQKN